MDFFPFLRNYQM